MASRKKRNKSKNRNFQRCDLQPGKFKGCYAYGKKNRRAFNAVDSDCPLK